MKILRQNDDFLIAIRRAGCYRHWKRAGITLRRQQAGRRQPWELFEVIYAEPETVRFLDAVRRLKEQRQRKNRRTRQAKQRVRAVLRRIRAD